MINEKEGTNANSGAILERDRRVISDSDQLARQGACAERREDHGRTWDSLADTGKRAQDVASEAWAKAAAKEGLNCTLNDLPSINFANRANLPTCCSAVYLAFNANGNCLYIGKAQDIRKRFINHKLVRLLDSIGDITLRWLHIPVGQLDRVERNLIFHFCPPLNIHHSPDATEKIKSSRRNIERPASDLDSDNPSITTKEAAEELGVTIGRVRQLVLDGTIKAERFGRALVISKAEIEKAKKRPDNRGRPAKRAKG